MKAKKNIKVNGCHDCPLALDPYAGTGEGFGCEYMQLIRRRDTEWDVEKAIYEKRFAEGCPLLKEEK